MKNQQIEELLLQMEPSPELDELREVLELFEEDFESKIAEIRRLKSRLKLQTLQLELRKELTDKLREEVKNLEKYKYVRTNK